MTAKSPLPKRIRLDPSASPSPSPASDASQTGTKTNKRAAGTRSSSILERDSAHDHPLDEIDVVVDEDEDHCVICLHRVLDRTVLPCAHDRLCFDCIFVWCQQSRKCPLCNAPIGPFLIHNLRSKYDYSKYYLPPLRISSPTSIPVPETLSGRYATTRSRGRTRGRTSRWGTRGRNGSASRERRERADELEVAIERRRWVYRHGLYAKHVASNPYTRYRPAPTPAQIAASPDLISRATIFVRRELRVWVNLDVEFLTTFILSLMKTLDLRSESAVKLLAEFLDMDTPYYIGDPEAPSKGRFANAERFSHELYSYLRSPFRDLAAYDAAVQYDTPRHIPPPPSQDHIEPHRWDVNPSLRPSPNPFTPRRHSQSAENPSPRPPSPSRSNSHAEYSSRDSPRVVSTNRISIDNRENIIRAPKASSSDVKGKGKASSSSKVDTRELDLIADTPANDHRRRTIDYGPRSSVQSDALPVHPVPQDLAHNSSDISDVARRYDDDKGRSDRLTLAPPASPLLATSTNANRNGESVTGEGIREEAHFSGVSETVEHSPRTVATSWGISIKGEAKRLGHLRELTQPASSDSHREPKLVEANPTQNTLVPRKRRNVTGLDVLHAHLGYASTSLAHETKRVSPKMESSATELPKAMGDNDIPSDSNRPADSATLPEPAADTSSRKSARDIMARTRAKLARLQAEPPQTPVTTLASDTPPTTVEVAVAVAVTGPESASASSSTDNLRSRLMERLEEEKRECSRHAPPPGLLDGAQPLTMDHHDHAEHEMRGGVDADETAFSNGTGVPNGNGSGDGSSSQAQQVEIKLRAQALMRVRLAAERKTASVALDQHAVRRKEEALRAKLLSRRT